jgi:hypothetical protein
VVGQEPNIRLGLEDLPRPTAKPAAPERWSPDRPGELGSPDEVPWGGAFGTPGPDTGFAYRVVRSMDLPGSQHARHDVEAAVVAVMAARASAIGRAPTAPDASVALELLDLSDEGMARLAGVAHDRARLGALVASIPTDDLIR